MLKQTLQQKLLQKLSPQQIQLMKLLQLPTVALEQRIKEEMEINPALEEGGEEDEDEVKDEEYDESAEGEESGSDDEFTLSDFMDQDDDETAQYKLKANNTSPDDERREVPLANSYTFHDLLESQLGLRPLSDHEYQVGLYLIGNIDEDGYLRRDLDSIVDDIAFQQNVITTREELEKLLSIIQEFDPPGVGARDLKECLMLQLERKSFWDENMQLAAEIITNYIDEFSRKHYDKIAKKIMITEERLKGAISEILTLNPKPGGSMAESQKTAQEVVPDFFISNENGQLELTLNSRNAPEMRIAKVYRQMLEEYAQRKDKTGKEAVQFVKQKIESAQNFIDAINQRQQTLLLTMQCIMDYQKEYFLTGDEMKLKPMILKDVSEKVGLDISTISRVSNSKYVQTPFGTFLLKSFFSESISTDAGEEVSSREVKKIMKDAIEAENKRKPLTDDELTQILKDKGYTIARRTVAKYREMLEIPVARLRKQL
ncbi:MAG: RNA polymerase factor sigma-54 [Bacteroidota bacterium]